MSQEASLKLSREIQQKLHVVPWNHCDKTVLQQNHVLQTGVSLDARQLWTSWAPFQMNKMIPGHEKKNDPSVICTFSPPPSLQANSTARQKHLLSLRDYMQRCFNEMHRMEQQVDERIMYNWDDTNLDYPARKRQYEVHVTWL